MSLTGVIATSSTLGSVTRTAVTANPSGNVHPVSSYGVFCGSFGLQYWKSSSASAIREYGWSMRMMYEPAGNVRVDVAPPDVAPPDVAPPDESRPAPRARRTGVDTVNGAFAREISTCCFCITRSSSACAPGRRSSAGSTYAAGPSVRAFAIERLLFSQKFCRNCARLFAK